MTESDVRCPNCKGEGFDYSKEPEFEHDTPQCLMCMGTGMIDAKEYAENQKKIEQKECE